MTVPTPTPTPITSPPKTLLISPSDITWKRSPSFTRPGYAIAFLINGIGMLKTAITMNGIEMITQENFVDLTQLNVVSIMDMADAFLAGTKDPLNTAGTIQTELDVYSYVKAQRSSAAFATSTWTAVPVSATPATTIK